MIILVTNEIPPLPETRLMPQLLVHNDELVQRVVSAQKVGDDNPKCVICEFIMTQLDEMLKNNATEVSRKTIVSLNHLNVKMQLLYVILDNNYVY